MNAGPADQYRPPISQDLATRHVSEFMTKKVVTANPTTSVKIAMQMMLQNEVSGLPVIDVQNRVVGVYSEYDALLQSASGSLDERIRYSTKVSAVQEETPFKDALILLAKQKVKRLPILDSKGQLVGIVSRCDLLQALFDDQNPA